MCLCPAVYATEGTGCYLWWQDPGWVTCFAGVSRYRKTESNVLVPVEAWKNNGRHMNSDCWPLRRGTGPGLGLQGSWLWLECAANSHCTAVTCTVTNTRDKINRTGFFKWQMERIKRWLGFFAWVTVTKAWTLHYGGRDESSLEPQAHNLKDKTMGTEYPSQAFTHCHLKKRPKTIIICDGGVSQWKKSQVWSPTNKRMILDSKRELLGCVAGSTHSPTVGHTASVIPENRMLVWP